MPKTPKPIWALIFVLIAYIPVSDAFDYVRSFGAGMVLNEAFLPNIGASLTAAALVALVTLFITHRSVRLYNPDSRLFAWRRDRWGRSLRTAILVGALAAATVYDLYSTLSERAYPEDIAYAFHSLGFLFWALMCRAAFVDREPSRKQVEDVFA